MGNNNLKKMKFDILKLILAFSSITICIHLVSSLQSKTGMATNMNLGLKSKSRMNMNMNMNMNMKSNYKMTMKGANSKNHNKKSESTNLLAKSNNKNTELNRMNSKIIFRGWLKYFKFPDDETQRKPKEFFKNALFERESKRKHAVGEDKIPSEKHFYAILFPENLNIYTTNNKATAQHSYDVLSIDYIRSIPENK